MSTAYIDLTCPYCTRLLAVISGDGVNPDPAEKLGFETEIVGPEDLHVASHKFPHVWKTDPDLQVSEETVDPLVSMFTIMTGIPDEDQKVREHIGMTSKPTTAGQHVHHIETGCSA